MPHPLSCLWCLPQHCQCIICMSQKHVKTCMLTLPPALPLPPQIISKNLNCKILFYYTNVVYSALVRNIEIHFLFLSYYLFSHACIMICKTHLIIIRQSKLCVRSWDIATHTVVCYTQSLVLWLTIHPSCENTSPQPTQGCSSKEDKDT